MRVWRTVLFCYLGLALAAPVWAFAPGACGELAAAQQSQVDTVAHHHHAHGHGAQADAAPDAGEADSTPNPALCECCDACASGCAFSLSAASGSVPGQAFNLQQTFRATLPRGLHDGPPGFPPLRPPCKAF